MTSRGLRDRRWIAWAVCGVLALAPGHLTTGAARGDDGVAPAFMQSVAIAPFVGDGPELSAKLSVGLAVKADEAASDEMLDVIVTFKNTSVSAIGRNGVSAELGLVERRDYRRLPFKAMRVPASSLNALASEETVEFVSPDSYVYTASLAARQTARTPGSTTALNTPNTAYRGAGVTAAVLDTGVWPHDDYYHTLVAQFDFVNEANGVQTAFSDPYGHGTHVAGMLGADGYNSSGAKYQGVATRTNIVSLRVLDGNGRGRISDVLEALDWLLVTGKPTYGVRIANLSFGKGVEEVQALDPLVQAVNAVWDAGVVVIVSAGNFGENGHFTISSPGNSRKVITVGSLTDRSTGTDHGDDFVSTFSSRGPTLFDHVLKPDLVAPGNKVVAPYASGSRLGSVVPADRVFCGTSASCTWRYMRMSGTSMAAGLVSGAVARMLNKDPSLGPNTIKARLMKSARKVHGDPTRVGAGVLDVESAMNATGTMYTAALSPLMNLSSTGTVVYVQNTAQLWGSSQWSSGSLWSDGSLWSSSSPWAMSGYLWSQGELWSDSSLWADGELWSEGFIWSLTVQPAAADIEDPDEGNQ